LYQLAVCEPDVQDLRRQELAIEILHTDDASLEINARKIKALFTQELTVAAEDGRLGKRLWAVLRAMSEIQPVDVQEMEGVNSMVKLICTRSRCITQQLLDSRIKVKKALGASDPASKSTKWSLRRPLASSLLEACHDAVCRGAADEVKSLPDRWKPPVESAAPAVTLAALVNLDPQEYKIPPSEAWARTANAVWSRDMADYGAHCCTLIGEPEEQKPCYLCVDRCALLGFMVQCKLQSPMLRNMDQWAMLRCR
jgi:hypothetical protein